MRSFARTALTLLALLLAPAAHADGPRVVASIRPLHGLVAEVMAGVGAPELLVPAGASPHTFALRPSDAQRLRQAQLVFWVGEQLEGFLDGPLSTLAGGARVVSLMDAPGVELLETRAGGDWEADEHGHEEEHGHAEYDAHVWLDPQNARAWVYEIARHLANMDPANAALYGRNATGVERRLESLSAEMEATLAPVRDKRFIVFHDAYRYLENRFGLRAVGSITVSPERAPGAKRVAALRDKVRKLKAVCVFAEPQFEPKLVRTLVEGTAARIGTLDPEGAALQDGPDLYFDLMRNLASGLASCLKR